MEKKASQTPEQADAEDQRWVDALNKYGWTRGFLEKNEQDKWEVTELGQRQRNSANQKVWNCLESLLPSGFNRNLITYDQTQVNEVRELMIDALKVLLGLRDTYNKGLPTQGEKFEMDVYPWVIPDADYMDEYLSKHRFRWSGRTNHFQMNCPHCADGTVFINVEDSSPDNDAAQSIRERQHSEGCEGTTVEEVEMLLRYCNKIKGEERYIYDPDEDI